MANLGTQDMAQYMAANAIRRGDTNMGLGYMLGSMLANAWNRHDTKKQQRKMDAFLNGQKADDIDFSKFGDATENALPAGGSVQNQAPAFDANNVIQPESSNAVDQYLKDQKVNGFNEYMATAPRTPKPFNPNRMQEFEAWARENNLRDEVAKKGRERVQREQMQDAEALYIPQIYKGIYGYKDEQGNVHNPDVNSRLEAIQAISQLAQFSPEKAKMLEKLGYAGNEADVANARKVAAADSALRGKMALASMNNANKVALKGMGKYANGGYSPKDVAGAYKAMQTIEDKYVDDAGNPIHSSKWSQLDRDEYLRNKNIYYGGVPQQGPAQQRQPQGPSVVEQLNADVDGLLKGKDMNDWNQFSKTADSVKELLSTKYGLKGDKLNKAMQGFFADNEMASTYFGTAKPQEAEAPSNNNTFSMSEVNTSKLFNEYVSNPQKFRDSHGGMSYSEYIKWLDSDDAKE